LKLITIISKTTKTQTTKSETQIVIILTFIYVIGLFCVFTYRILNPVKCVLYNTRRLPPISACVAMVTVCLQCVQYVDGSVLPELVPRLTELIKSGIGVGTKVRSLYTW